MSGIWIAGNAVVVQSSLIIAGYVYYRRTPPTSRSWPWVSATIVAVTGVVSGLALAYPDVLPALQRDGDALLDGEVWRLVTPLFVQGDGVPQIVLNGFLALVFLPVAERVYGNRLWLVYFASGVVGQIANYWWIPEGAGSSTAIFGAMGAMHAYVLRRALPHVEKPFLVISSVALAGGVLLALVHDGHGVGLLGGALTALLLPRPKAVRDHG